MVNYTASRKRKRNKKDSWLDLFMDSDPRQFLEIVMVAMLEI